MNKGTRVRHAARLMAYIEELHGLRKFTKQERCVIQEALFLLIKDLQQASANNQAVLPPGLLPPISTKIYELKEGKYAPNRILVYEDGQPERRLQHVPIFSYGFGLTGLSALDSALAILADSLSEPLSLRAFASGQHSYCHLYQAFAREVLTRPRFHGHFETKHIRTFLERAWRRKPVEGNKEFVREEKHNEEISVPTVL